MNGHSEHLHDAPGRHRAGKPFALHNLTAAGAVVVVVALLLFTHFSLSPTCLPALLLSTLRVNCRQLTCLAVLQGSRATGGTGFRGETAE